MYCGVHTAGTTVSFERCKVHSPRRDRPGTSLRREARLEHVFVLLLRAFRSAMLIALEDEPPGPARHVRAYVRTVCEYTQRLPRAHARALNLLQIAAHKEIWDEFVDEACANDEVAIELSVHCRSTVERLWLLHATQWPHRSLEPPDSDASRERIRTTRDRLLALSEGLFVSAPQ